MRKIILFLVLCLLFSTTMLRAQEADSTEEPPDTIAWYTNYDEALKLANSEDRYLLIEFFADW